VDRRGPGGGRDLPGLDRPVPGAVAVGGRSGSAPASSGDWRPRCPRRRVVLPCVAVDIGSILGIWAHPDDEAYLSAGLMANAIRRGHRVVVALATSGQSGTPRPDLWPPEKLGPHRQKEMAAAMSLLGVTDVRWLGYEDGKCSTVPSEEAIDKLSDLILEVGPDSVLTFGPDGATGHEDHITVSGWVTAAFERAARPGSRLYYAAAPDAYYEEWNEIFAKYNVFYPGYPIHTDDEEIVLTYPVPDELMDQKKRAIRAHASQVDGFINEVGEETFFSLNVIEWFRLGAEKQRADDAAIRRAPST
jgi:LmbE family N-acetylglucosaminyl deacetylase